MAGVRLRLKAGLGTDSSETELSLGLKPVMDETPEPINNRIAGQDNFGSAGFHQTAVAILVPRSGPS